MSDVVTATLGRAGWRKSTHSSSNGDCVDVDFTLQGAEIRHSKAPAGPSIAFTATEWNAWLRETVAPEPTNTNGAVVVEIVPDGWVVREVRGDAVLVFTHEEISAFRAGVVDGEFDRDAALANAAAELAPVS